MLIKIELVKDDCDAAVAQTLSKHANTPSLRVVELSIADEYLRHVVSQECLRSAVDNVSTELIVEGVVEVKRIDNCRYRRRF